MDVKEAAAEYLPEAVPQTIGKDVPAGYKRTEAGVIPKEWILAELPDIAWFQEGPGVRNYQFTTSGVKLFNGTNIELGEINLEATDRHISEREAYGSYRHFLADPGDIVIACSGISVNRFDEKVAVLSASDLPLCMNTSTMRFKVYEDRRITKEYFIHFLKSRSFKDQISGTATGSAQLNFGPAHVSKVWVPLPTKTEQHAIAEALSDADALIASLQRLIAKKRAIKQGTMQALLTGRQRLPGFTGEWQTKPMGELFTFSGGMSASREQLSSKGHCYLHYGDIHTSTKTVMDVRTSFANIPKLDVPLSKVSRGSLLNTGDVVFVDASEDVDGASKYMVVENPDGNPFISGLHTIVAKPISDALVPAYCRFCFQTRSVKSQFRFFAAGTKVLGVSKGNIGKIEVLVPARKEQTAMATILADMDAEIEALETRLAKTRQLKTGMMQQLLTGRIRLPLGEAA